MKIDLHAVKSIDKHRSSFNARVVDRRMCFIGLVYL